MSYNSGKELWKRKQNASRRNPYSKMNVTQGDDGKRPEDNVRAGAQSHVGVKPTPVSYQSQWEGMGPWDRAVEWVKRSVSAGRKSR